TIRAQSASCTQKLNRLRNGLCFPVARFNAARTFDCVFRVSRLPLQARATILSVISTEFSGLNSRPHEHPPHTPIALRRSSSDGSECDQSATDCDKLASFSGVNLRSCQMTDFCVTYLTMHTSAICKNGWGSIGLGFDSLHPLH